MEIKKICVIGAGQMGQQIALGAAINGFDVILNDSFNTALEKADKWSKEYLAGRIEKGKMTQAEAEAAQSRFKIEKDLAMAAQAADLVIEAIVEKLDIKRELFARLDRLCPAHTILASNTSSFVPSKLADATTRADKVVDMHFFNPALVMELVEVVQGPQTSDETAQAIMQVSRQMQKTPILLKKEINGFVVNRILGRTFEEACRLLALGIASPEDIDIAVTKGLRWPMGPCATMDLSGIDTCYNIRVQRFAESQEEIDRPPAILKEMLDAGTLGRKSGKGFYDYSKK